MFCPIIQSTNYPVLGISKSFFFDFQKLSHHHGIMRCLATEKKSCVGIRGLNPRGGRGGDSHVEKSGVELNHYRR